MMDVTPVVNLIGAFTDAGQKIAPALAALGFITSSLQLLRGACHRQPARAGAR